MKTKVKVKVEGDQARITFPFDRGIVNLVGSSGLGMKWNATRKEWSHPVTYNFVSSLSGVFPELHLNGLQEYIPPCDFSSWMPSTYLMDHQLFAAKTAEKNPRFAFFHDTGCHGRGQKILLHNGKVKKVEEIIVGDKLMGPDSSPREVLKLYSGQDEMYRVIPVKGKPFVVNKRHLLYVQFYRHLCKRYVVEHNLITVGEYVEQPERRKHCSKLVRANEINFHQRKSLPLDPYFLGIFIADGHSVKDSTPGISASNQTIISEILSQAKKMGLRVRTERKKDSKTQDHFFSNSIRGYNSNPLKKILRYLNLNCLTEDKHIPHIYKVSSRKNRLYLLAGLLDGDGFLSSPNGYELVTKSKQLSEDMLFLCRSLGLAAYKKEKQVKSYPDNIYYRISISGDTYKIPCKVKKAHRRKQKKNVLVTGFTVKPLGVDNYYGFELDKDGLYLLDDFTITHNTGKTVSAIEIIKQKQVKTLVVCPLGIIETAWMEDISKFSPDITAANLWALRQGSSRKKKAALKRLADSAQVCLINFETFKLMLDEIYSMNFEMLIVDESSKAKSATTTITKRLTEFADRMPYVYLLSGTPAPNSPLEYFSQMRMLSQSLLGSNYYSFRKKYAHQNSWNKFAWVMKPDMFEEFMEKLSLFSEVVRKEDVLDLPDRTYNEIEFTMSKPEMAAYRKMKADLMIELEGETVTAANAAVKLGKLRQGSSGFYYDEAGSGIAVGVSKLTALLGLLEEIGDKQVIIWTQFRYEASQIHEKLADRAVRADGTVSQKKKIDNIKRFKAGDAQYMIAHPASLGHGQTLTNCTYAVYYSLSYSLELQEQSEGRIYRKGTTQKCSYFFLVGKKTVDRNVISALRGKKDISDAILNHLRNG